MCRDHHISCSLSLHRVTLSFCSFLESSYSRGRESAIVDLRKLNRLLDLYNECFWKFRTILRIHSVPVHLLDVRLLTPLTRIKPHLWLASPETKGHNTTDRIRHQFNRWRCLESIACAPWGQIGQTLVLQNNPNLKAIVDTPGMVYSSFKKELQEIFNIEVIEFEYQSLTFSLEWHHRSVNRT